MVKPFPHIKEHKTFPSTFLFGVEWRVYYHIEGFKDSYTNFATFVKNVFGMDLRYEEFMAMGILPLRYIRQTGDTKVKFTPDFAEFTFSGDSYISFNESVKDVIFAFVNYVLNSGGSVGYVNCNKKNLVNFTKEDGLNSDELLSFILSPALLKYPNYVLREADFSIDRQPSTQFVQMDIEAYHISALYGVYAVLQEKAETEKKEYGVMVESQCESYFNSKNPFSVNSLNEINSIMYDFFSWAFSKVVYEAMES